MEATAKKSRSRSKEEWRFFMIPILGLAWFGFVSMINDPGRTLSIETDTAYVSRSEFKYDRSLPQHDCLGMGDDEGMDKLLDKYKQVIILLPSKAAGTTMKTFSKMCMDSVQRGNVYQDAQNAYNPLNHADQMFGAFRKQLELPSLIANHITPHNDEVNTICNVAKHATIDTLVVYVHRKETSRVLSSIKEVLTMDNGGCGVGRPQSNPKPGPGVTMVGKHKCYVKEEVVINKIKNGYREVGNGATRHLTCDAYDCIKDNAPNLVFMHYKQASRVQKLLAKHHCPGVTKEVQENVGAEKNMAVYVDCKNAGNVTLGDWLRAKSQLLELTYDTKANVSCQGTTKDIEYEMLACPDEALQISGRSYDGRKMQFPV